MPEQDNSISETLKMTKDQERIIFAQSWPLTPQEMELWEQVYGKAFRSGAAIFTRNEDGTAKVIFNYTNQENEKITKTDEVTNRDKIDFLVGLWVESQRPSPKG
jgi:hypothetical protein